MLTITVGDLLDEDSYKALTQLLIGHARRNTLPYTIYTIKNESEVFYTGMSEWSAVPRLLDHLGIGDFKWSQEPSELGTFIQRHLPVSLFWQIELRTTEECRDILVLQQSAWTKDMPISVHQAELAMIDALRPTLNRANSGNGNQITEEHDVGQRAVGIVGNTAMPEAQVLTQYAGVFLDSLRNVRQGTRSAYTYALKLFLAKQIPIEADVYERFSHALLIGKYAQATRKLYLVALREFVRWLINHGFVPSTFNTAEAEARLLACQDPSSANHRSPVHTVERLPEVIAYYDALELPKDKPAKRLEILRSRAIMHTLYSSAGRVSELTSLTRDQVDSGESTTVEIKGRNSRQRTLYLTGEARQAIRNYCNERGDDCSALFISHGRSKGHSLTRTRIWQTVRDAARALGINDQVSPHSFRHYRATQLLNEGMSLEFVQEYLGHASPATTRMVYAQVNKRVLKEQLNEFGLSPKEALKRAKGDS